MKTPTTNAIQYATRPYTRSGFQIESIEKGRITLTRRVHQRGSILVLVVVLLVLLALMGTAYITTTRVDRFSADRNRANTKDSLIVDGIEQMVIAQVANMPQPTVAQTAQPFSDFRNGLYLAARHPQALGTPAPSLAAWPSISMPLNAPAFSGAAFVDPSAGPGSAPVITFAPTAVYKDTFFFEPRNPGANQYTLTLRDAAGQLIDATGAVLPPGSTPVTFTAADTDGDGIADAAFFPIPGASADGLTYYAAVRIVDGNSAINVNTAWSQSDFDRSGTALTNPNQGLFLTSTGLHELLDPFESGPTLFGAWTGNGYQAQRLHILHTGQSAWGANGSTLQNGITGQTGALACVYDDFGNKREFLPSGSNVPDFQFVSQGEALSSQLGRRLDFPGVNGASTSYRSLPLSDQLQLSYPFAIRSVTASQSITESMIAESSWNNAAKAPYPGTTATADWYSDNFNWAEYPAGSARPKAIRSYFVTRNPTSNSIPLPVPATPPVPAGLNPPAHPTKADANTSDFVTLWRAYWSVMADPGQGDRPRTSSDPMFQTSARGNDFVTNSAKNTEMLMLRSAMAAANTIALREGNATIASDVIPSFYVPLNNPATTYATVFGLKRQPFITQVICERQVNDADLPADLKTNIPLPAGATFGYIGIEIYNPNPTETVDLTNYRVVIYDRSAVAPYFTVKSILPFNPGDKIGPTPATATATSTKPQPRYIIQDGNRPTSMSVPSGVVYFGMSGLLDAVGREVAIVRPRNPAGEDKGTMQPNGTSYDERLKTDGFPVPDDSNIVNWVPLDQIDLRSLAALPALNHATVNDNSGNPYKVPDRERYTYIRPSYDGLDKGNPWECVFAGNYTQTINDFLKEGPGAKRGAGENSDPPDISKLDYTADVTTAALGVASNAHVPVLTALVTPNYSIEVNPFGTAGPNPYQVTPAVTNQFPFGGFARSADILQVPFIGAYKIDSASGIYEINSVSMDAVKVMNPAIAIPTQKIGRFWPIPASTTYDWARHLFEFVTVQSPQNDYLPNVANGTNIPYNNGTAYSPTPQAVQNGPITTPLSANGTSEWSVGVNGLININTASWKVLSMLPLVVDSTGKVDNATGNNDAMAKAIVAYREASGPYQSIFGLLNIPANYTGLKNPRFVDLATPAAPTTPVVTDTAAFGELMPVGGDTTFRTGMLQLARISNLVTTRSDTFTLYLLVQGWRAGATAPEVERRAAYYIDRTGANPTVVPIPTR